MVANHKNVVCALLTQKIVPLVHLRHFQRAQQVEAGLLVDLADETGLGVADFGSRLWPA